MPAELLSQWCLRIVSAPIGSQAISEVSQAQGLEVPNKLPVGNAFREWHATAESLIWPSHKFPNHLPPSSQSTPILSQIFQMASPVTPSPNPLVLPSAPVK